MAKTTIASLEAQFLAFKASTEGEIAELKSRLNAVASSNRSTRQSKNVGRPITPNQAKAIGEFGVDTEGWDFMQASRFLDEMSAFIRALGIVRISCRYCDRGVHNDRDLARQCAMSGDKRTPKSEPAPEASDLELPAYA